MEIILERFSIISLQSLPIVEGVMHQALLEYAGNANPGANVCVPQQQFIPKLQYQTPENFSESDFQK